MQGSLPDPEKKYAVEKIDIETARNELPVSGCSELMTEEDHTVPLVVPKNRRVSGCSELMMEEDHFFTPEEERFLEAMHFQRTREMLRSRSTKFIHKFSIACPAHIVATAICIWIALLMAIEGGVMVDSLSHFKALDARIADIERHIAPLNGTLS